MNTHTRLASFLVFTVLAVMVSACKPRFVIGPEQTFAINVPRLETSGYGLGEFNGVFTVHQADF